MSTSAFDRLAPFIQDYIYRNKWSEMRDVQVAACEVIFDTDTNLLLASGTASGKTEAAFLPVLTQLYENPSSSVGVLYISPLKALINDQFLRLNDLLENAGISVTKWHGDVNQNIKSKLLIRPQGILQTTPESLEAMLMRKQPAILKLFCDLKYIIIDEVHYFMSNDRGTQLLCILENIQRLTGNVPRRIGLSATLGDYSAAEKWLNSGTNRICTTPLFSGIKRHLRLSLQHFTIESQNNKLANERSLNDYYNYIYENTKGKRCILFSNSKTEVEANIAHLKAIAKSKKTPDIYYVHHGNISAALREYTEEQMKHGDTPIVTGATLTLELGIDLGELERIVQTGSPLSVSSFVQRLGRSGRRNKPSEMWFVFKEEEASRPKLFYQTINWEFLMCIAIIQLYLEEKWIEPIPQNVLPYGLLYHQTMSYMVSAGEVNAASLAQHILTLSPFERISQADYKILLHHMLSSDQLQFSERKGLLIGLEGEKQVNHFEFYSVFETPMVFSVKYKSEEIGTVQVQFPVGARFALAGRTWEVIDIDKKSQSIFVNTVRGMSTNMWISPMQCPVHTKLMKKIQDILLCDMNYRYLGDKAVARLQSIRKISKNSEITTEEIVKLSNSSYAVFPWLGTKAMFALSYALDLYNCKNHIEFDHSFIPICIIVTTEKSLTDIIEILKTIKSKEIDKQLFNVPDDANVGGKFNEFIPQELLRKQYIEDYVDVNDMKENL